MAISCDEPIQADATASVVEATVVDEGRPQSEAVKTGG